MLQQELNYFKQLVQLKDQQLNECESDGEVSSNFSTN